MFLRAISAWFLPRRRRLDNGMSLNARDRGGFPETLIVIAIVCFLLACAAESYRPALGKAAMTEAASLLALYKTELHADLAVYGRLPGAPLAHEQHRRTNGRYFSELEWRDGEIVAGLEQRLSALIEASAAMPESSDPLTLSFRVARSPDHGQLVLLCGLAEPPPGFDAAPPRQTTVPSAYLPSFCRN